MRLSCGHRRLASLIRGISRMNSFAIAIPRFGMRAFISRARGEGTEPQRRQLIDHQPSDPQICLRSKAIQLIIAGIQGQFGDEEKL